MAREVPIVEKSDNRKGIIASAIYLITLLFLLFFITYSEPDPPKVTVSLPILMGDDGITDFDIHNAGGGSPADAANPVPQPEENPKEQHTQEEESPVKVNKGTGSTPSNNSSSQEAAPTSPFSGGGNGGSGTGSGGGFGADTGPGTGSGEPGQGLAGNRVRVSNIHTMPKTPNNEHCQIALKLTVDSQGKVLRADVDRNNTTTTNQRLIDEVIELAKKEVRYKEKPGAKNELLFYTVTVQPN